MIPLLKGLKVTALILSGVTGCIIIGTVLFFQSKSPHDLLKNILEKELSKVFAWELKIKEIQGNLVTGFSAEELTLSHHEDFEETTFFQAEKVDIKLNLWKLLKNKMDIQNCISEIQLINGQLNFIRNTEDKWTLFMIFRPPPPGEKSSPPTFQGKIKMKNIILFFQDHKGWGKENLEIPFESSFLISKGEIDYKKVTKAKMQLKGKNLGSKAPLFFWGFFNAINGQYEYSFQTILPLSKWGAYSFPFEGYNLYHDNTMVKGTIRSKMPVPKNKIPFWYEITIKPESATIKCPFLIEPIKETKGEIHLSHGKLRSTDFINDNMPRELGEKIKALFIRNKFLDQEGNVIRPITEIKTFIKKRLPSISKQLLDLFDNPPAYMMFNHFKGEIDKIPIKGSGIIYLDKEYVKMNIQTLPYELSRMKKLFSGIKNWKMRGLAISKLAISGPMSSPVVKGNVFSERTKLYGFYPKNMYVSYIYHQNKFDFRILEGDLYGGTVSGEGTINLLEEPAELDILLRGNRHHIAHVFPSFLESIKGRFEFQSKWKGKVDNYTINTWITGQELTVRNQSIDKLYMRNYVKKNEHILIPKGRIWLNENDASLTYKGEIRSLKALKINVEGQDVEVRDIGPQKEEVNTGSMEITAVIRSEIDDMFWKKPLNRTSASLNVKLIDYPFYNHTFKQVTCDLKIENKEWLMTKLIATNDTERVEIEGRGKAFKPIEMRIKTTQFDIDKSEFLQQKIPNRAKPFSGKLDMQVQIDQHKLKIVGENQAFGKSVKDYIISGELVIKDGAFLGQPYDLFSTKSNWQGVHLDCQEAELKYKNSYVKLSGSISSKGDIKLNLKETAKINLNEFQIVIAPYGNWGGELMVDGKIIGSISTPGIDINIRGSNITSDFLGWDLITGDLFYDQRLFRGRKLNLKRGKDEYQVSGYIDMNSILQDKKMTPDQLDFELLMKIKDGDLNILSQVVEQGYKEVKTRVLKQEEKEKIMKEKRKIKGKKRKRNQFQLQDPYFLRKRIKLYKKNSRWSAIDFYKSIEDKQDKIKDPENLGLEKLMRGTISGELYAKSKPKKQMIINSNLEIINAKIGLLETEKITIIASSEKSKIGIGIETEKGTIGGKEFDKLKLRGIYDEIGNLWIRNTDIITGQRTNKDVLKGVAPISAIWDIENKTPLDITLYLRGDDIGTLSIFNTYIDNIKNKGEVKIRISGDLHQPIINTRKAELDRFQIYFSKETIFRSPLEITSRRMKIQNNKIEIPKTSIVWKGIDTNDKENRFQVSGQAKINNFTFVNPNRTDLEVDLKIEPTEVQVNLPTIYRGDIQLGTTYIKGTYQIPQSEKEKQEWKKRVMEDKETGPVISGNITLNNGDIVLPSVGKKKFRPSLLLDMRVNIKENVEISGSLFGSGPLAVIANNFNLELEETQEKVPLKGSFNIPKIQEKLYISDGDVNLLNKNFETLKLEEQEVYYKEEQYKIHQNAFSFQIHQEETGQIRVIPVFDISAYTIIEPIEEESATTENIENESPSYKAVIIKLKGPIYDLNNLVFDVYDQAFIDPRRVSPVFEKTYNFSTEAIGQESALSSETTELLVLLMPELSNTNFAEQSQKLINVIGENQINAYFRKKLLRPIEKQVARQIGVESIRVDYNLGGQILGPINQGTEEPNILGLSFRKLLSNQLYLSGRTRLDLDSARQESSQFGDDYEIELQYYIIENIAFSVSNVKEVGDDVDFAKLKLKAGYEY